MHVIVYGIYNCMGKPVRWEEHFHFEWEVMGLMGVIDWLVPHATWQIEGVVQGQTVRPVH